MSRIILSRFSNGEEHLVVGYDRPMGSYFAHEYDEEGDCVYEVGSDIYGPIRSTEELVDAAEKAWIVIDWTTELRETLEAHSKLEYPESNVVVDRTRQ